LALKGVGVRLVGSGLKRYPSPDLLNFQLPIFPSRGKISLARKLEVDEQYCGLALRAGKDTFGMKEKALEHANG
jgi:hypothetical protein